MLPILGSTKTTVAVTLAGMIPLLCGCIEGDSRAPAVDFRSDPSGGSTALLFKVPSEAAGAVTEESLDKTLEIIRLRLDPAGSEGVRMRKRDGARIEVTVPTTNSRLIEQTKRVVCRPGTLEFAILANRRDHKSLIAAAEKAEGYEVTQDGRAVARWCGVSLDENGDPRDIGEHGEVVTREVEMDGASETQFLLIVETEERAVTHQYLERAYSTIDQNGSPAVGFQLTTRGARLFFLLTSKNSPARDGFQRRLAIVVDGRIHSAPNIMEAIPGGGGQITGFNSRQVDEVIAILNAEPLPVPLQPVPEEQIPEADQQAPEANK